MRTPLFLTAIGILALLPLTAAAQTPYMNRAQMLALTLDVRPETRELVNHYRSHRSRIALFTDIDQNSQEAPYVEAAFRSGLIRGYDDRTIRLEESVSVEEASAVLLIAAGIPLPTQTEDPWNVAVFREAIKQGMYKDISQVVPGQPITVADFTDMERRIGLLEPVQNVGGPVLAANEAVEAPPVTETAYLQEPAPEVIAPDEPLTDGFMRMAAQPTNDGSVIQEYASGLDFGVSIPALGVKDLPIFHPDDPGTSEGVLSVLQHGVGHLFSYPGRGGKIMVYGHSSSYPWDVSPYTKIFRQVNKLKTGDDVYVMYKGQLFHYQVTGQEQIAPDDNSPFTGEGEELLLYTCWPPDSTKSRLIIRAAPVQMVAVR